jgi:hypothetical protein
MSISVRMLQATNDEREWPEPAATGLRMGTETNGWLRSTPRFCSALSLLRPPPRPANEPRHKKCGDDKKPQAYQKDSAVHLVTRVEGRMLPSLSDMNKIENTQRAQYCASGYAD